MKKPLILREITKYYSADSFLGGNAQKQVSVAFRANNIIFGQKTFQIHDGQSEDGLQWKKSYFRRQDFKSFQREAASPVRWEILRREALYFNCTVLCGTRVSRLS